MRPSLILALLLALLQPGFAPAAQAFAPGPEPATAADCVYAMDMAPDDGCEHDDCDCDSTCSSALFPDRQSAATLIPRPARVHGPAAVPRTGFLRTPFRPPSS